MRSNVAAWVLGAVAMCSLLVLAQGPRPLTLKEQALRSGNVHEIHEADALPIPAEDVVKSADIIVIGTVLESRSRLSPSGYSVITEHNVKVNSVIKSRIHGVGPGQILKFTQLGGVVSDSSTRIEFEDLNTPLLTISQSYVLIGIRRADMLSLYGPGSFRIDNGRAKCHSKHAQDFNRFCGLKTNEFVTFLEGAATKSNAQEQLWRSPSLSLP